MVQKKPGKLAHSHWLTTANLILRLFVATKEPSDNLRKISEYIVKIYAPIWFNIKFNASLEHGHHHLYKAIKLTQNLSEQVKEIFYPVMQRNVFYSHPENLLMSMINDENCAVRELSWRRIK